MIVKKLYEKGLSGSERKVTTYNMCENISNDHVHYGLQLVTSSKKFNEKQTIQDISHSKSFVCDLARYLYENAVDTIHFRDIVDDYVLKSEDCM